MAAILVTGANGFVGGFLCAALVDRGHQVKAAIRGIDAKANLNERVLPIVVGDINAKTDWLAALRDVEVVIHLAARVHVMQENALDADEAFQRVNTLGTKNLAQQAADAGVRRFIFLSSIKVLGEFQSYLLFDHLTPVAPQDPYARSKCAAEQSLQTIAATKPMQTVIVRTPLVYGAGVKGNFLRLMQLIARGWPLPLCWVKNKRSMVSVENLCDLLVECVNHPAAAGEVFLCADAESYSTPDLIRQLAVTMGKPIRLWPVPVGLLKIFARLLRKQAEVSRLCDSLQVDTAYTQQRLNWQPPFTLAQGLAKTAAAFLNTSES